MRPEFRALVLAASAAPLFHPSVAAGADDDSVSHAQVYQVITARRLSDPLVMYGQGADTPRAFTASAAPTPRSLTDAIWIGLGNNQSWLNSSNWSTNLVPNADGATARFRNVSGGPIAQLGSASIMLGNLEMSDPLLSAVVGGTINLSGSATVHSHGVSFDLPNTLVAFAPADLDSRTGSNNIGGEGSFTTAIVGNDGLHKTGDTHIQIESEQHYLGSTTISGGRIISLIGDAAFGNAANSIVLNGGAIVVDLSDLSSSRPINVLEGGGTLFWTGSNRSIDYAGNIAGVGHMQFHGGFGDTGPATITTSQSLFGTFSISSGTVVLAQAGALPLIAELRNQGTLVLDNAASPVSVDRLSSVVPIVMRGAALTARAPASGYTESVGPVHLDGGVSFFTAIANGSIQLNLGTLTRSSGGGAVFRGMNLGNAPGAGTANIYIANGPDLLKKGLIPFAWGHAKYNSFSTTPENVDNTLVTYGANGVAPVTGYAPDFVGSGVNTNVRLTANASLAGSVSANALLLSAPATLQADGGGAGLSLTGPGTLVLDSGVILSGHAGYTNLLLGTINSFPGNLISANVTAGSNELIVMTPSALTISGVISGTGGLTKLGGRTAQFSGANTYTGPTVLNGLNRFVGNVLADGTTPGPYGRDTSPIVLYGGGVSPIHPAGFESGSGFAQLGGNSVANTTFDRDIEARGTQVLLRNFGTGTLAWNGNIAVQEGTTLSFVAASSGNSGEMTVNGIISGPARVQNFPGTITNFTNANTFTGGFDLDGTVGVGHDQALSTGSIVYHSAQGGTLQAVGGARTIANDLVILAGTGGSLTISGQAPITLSGNIVGRGGDYVLNVSNTATTTFTGVLSGGAFRKAGMGTLVVSGDNIYDSIMTVGSGSTAGGMVILRSNTATGSVIGPTLVEFGENALALDGDNAPGGSVAVLEENLILTGDGLGGFGSLRNLSGDNVWGGIVRPSASYVGPSLAHQRATIGVDSGTLTIDSTMITSDPGVVDGGGPPTFLANSIGIRKLGPGVLVVGSDVINTAVGSINFEWNGAILATGSLDIQAGTVRLKPSAGIATIASGKTLSDIGSLNIAGGSASPTAKLDIANNAVLVDYSGGSPLSDLRAYIVKGYNFGNWQGNGITSSLAPLSPNAGETGTTAIGYAEASAIPGLTVFMGNPVDSTSVLIKYTYEGDTDLDGDVDIADLGRLATSWQNFGGWINGDFDYSGFVDVNDLGKLATNWQDGVGNPLAPADLGAALKALGLPSVTIPEPTGVMLLTWGGKFLLRRRGAKRVNTL
jgi:hypothetical protein